MILTKKKALKICVELWDWMAKSGSESKAAWPGWTKRKYAKNDCPCCEYALSGENPRGCGKCPLFSLWQDKCITSSSSPYWKWSCLPAGTDHSEYAKIIANAARKELKKLTGRKK